MPRKLKVYGWRGYRGECPPAPNGSHQTREIMAALSMAAVTRAMGYKNAQTGIRQLDLCETGNDNEIETAMNEPGAVFWCPLNQLPKDRAWTRAPEVEEK